MRQKIRFERRLTYEGNQGDKEFLQESEILGREEPVIILGQPGMGKSTLTTALAEQEGVVRLPARTFVRRSVSRPKVEGAQVVVIDALDELPANADGEAVDRVLEALAAFGNPQFVLSCRSFDWQNATTAAEIFEQYGHEPLVLSLEPLTREEQIRYLTEHAGADRSLEVVEHFEAHHLDFLGNPMTLQLVAELDLHNQLPETRKSLYERAVDHMSRERNDAKADQELPRQRVLDAAGATFATLILCGKASVSRMAAGNVLDDDVPLSEMKALLAPGDERAFDTRLFDGKSERFTYWHRQIGEFLGARWLASKANNARKRRRLLQLMHSEGKVPTSLRGLHAWLAQESHFAPDVIATDPMGVVVNGDVSSLPETVAPILLDAIAQWAENTPFFDIDRVPNALCLMSQGCLPASLEWIMDKNAPDPLRGYLLNQIREPTLATELTSVLMKIVTSQDEGQNIRLRAGRALLRSRNVVWPDLLDELLAEGTRDASVISYEAMVALEHNQFEDRQIVALALAYDGFSLEEQERATRLFARSMQELLEWIPVERVERVVEEIRFQVGLSTVSRQHNGWSALADFYYGLIVRYIASGNPDTLRIASWLPLFKHAQHFGCEPLEKISNWLRQNTNARREIQAHFLRDQPIQSVSSTLFQIRATLSALAPDEEDIAALLDQLEADDNRWKGLVEAVPHDGKHGAPVRSAARRFAEGNPQNLRWLDELAIFGGEMAAGSDHQKEDPEADKASKKLDRWKKYKTKIANTEGVTSSLLDKAADIYLGHFSDVSGGFEPHERLIDYFGQDAAEILLKAFSQVLVPEGNYSNPAFVASKIAEDGPFAKGNLMIAALAEHERQRPSELPFEDLTEGVISVGYYALQIRPGGPAGGRSGLSGRLQEELERRGALEGAMVTLIEPQLAKGESHPIGLHGFTTYKAFADYAPSHCLQWLKKYHDLHRNSEENLIDRVLTSNLSGELSKVSEERLSKDLERERSLNWQAVRFLLDPEHNDLEKLVTADRDLVWFIRDRMVADYHNRRAPVFWAGMKIEQVLSVFRSIFPLTGPPTKGLQGNKNVYDGGEFLRNLLDILANRTGLEDRAALHRILDGPRDSYTPFVQAAVAAQRRKSAEEAFIPADPAQLHAILNEGPPASNADLQAILIDALDRIQAKIKGSDADDYKRFYRDDGQHRLEEECRHALMQMLRAEEGGLQYTPEAHLENDKRVDLLVQTGDKSFMLPIEAKGQWHSELWRAPDDQLDYLYINDWRADRGVYLVFWFGLGVSLTGAPRGSKIVNPKTPEDLQERLATHSITAKAGKAAIYVLDLSRPQKRRAHPDT